MAVAARKIGVAMDFSPSSKNALKWAMENVIRKGDQLILVTVRPEGHCEKAEMQPWEVTGSPFIPLTELSDPATMKKYGVKHDPEIVDIVSAGAKQKEVEILMKVYRGDPREKLCEAIGGIPLSCIIVGNRGLGKLKRAIMGSVSNYVVNNGPCAVTVVKHHV
ncbi:hypothetical protein V6N13_047692 [Hibiscus sabdariffa]|uniref:UspA domain-containing protein n=1 Tax=Hibiscus sabdariffa TaxID=183260 RepID=A0ABR2F4X8_9ROSI